jgi:SAM-dependent methyltransferase
VTRIYSERVDLYDRAFGWVVDDEIDWLLALLGPRCRRVLEPGCGTGRYLEALERRGIEAVGIDNSPAMIETARRRGTAVLADMAAFELGRSFDGAICAISTVAVLTSADCARHLACTARHLNPGGRYLVQLAIRDPEHPEGALHLSLWERAGVRVTWSTEALDLVRGEERQGSKIEVLEGPSAGEVVEEVHVVTAWTPASWSKAVEASPFALEAVYDAALAERPRVKRDASGRLLWHVLVQEPL